jgi:alpha-ketoglutarate-dependent 2,4-dichlorophenoxyacetate dioxygenase
LIGVDARRAIEDGAIFEEIDAALEIHSVVLLRGQDMDQDSQIGFTRLFGELEFDHIHFGQKGLKRHVYNIGNVGEDGKHLGADHQTVKFGTGNFMWHSDSSFRAIPAKMSVSLAHEVSAEGGELEFVSTRAAYYRLPHGKREKLSELVAVHDYVFSRSKVSPDAVTPEHAASLPPMQQKLVRMNSATGKQNFYIGSHARSIIGWTDAAASELLNELLALATTPEHIYQHRWEVGDLLIWDNRCMLHRGRPYDADKHRRRMSQSRALCAAPTLEE